MRVSTGWIAVFWLFSFALSQSFTHGGESFPYTAHVTANKINVRSGPGGDFYPTSELSRGDTVEVYWQNDQGWFAVKPPEGSFSWVPATALKPNRPEHVAEVVQEQVPAQIGSLMRDRRNAAQVQLDRGELVEILELVESGDQPWYKIAPPAGEFRWIREGDIDRQPLPIGEHLPEVVLIEPVPVDDARGPVQLAEVAPSRSARLPPTPTNQFVSWTSRRRGEGDAKSFRESGPRWRKPGASPKLEPDSTATGLTERIVQPEPLSANKETIPLEANPTLMDLEIALSRMVSRPKSIWRLEPLRARARHLAVRGKTFEERQQARVMLKTLAEFEQIRLRYEQTSIHPLIGAGAPSVPLASESGASDADITTSGNLVAANSPYDGSGWLMPVVTRRRDVPQYALTDDYGRILKFVTPAPGLNLRRYLRRQIGVTGTQRTIPQLYRPHLMAERVMVLDRQRR